MTWARLDDGWDQHPKMKRAMAKVGDAAPAMYSRAITQCCRYLTDGAISGAELLDLTSHKRPQVVIDTLVEVNLLERQEGVQDAYLVHDFLDWNPSRAAVEKRRDDKARAGASGGVSSGVVRRSKREAEPKHVLQPCSAPATASGSPSANPHPDPVPDPVPAAPSEQRSGASPGLTLAGIRAELRRHPATARLAEGTLGEAILGRAMTAGHTAEDVAQAIAEAAADAPDGISDEALRRKVRAYCDRARQRPASGPIQPISAAWSPRRVDDPEKPLPMARPGESAL